MFSSLTQPRFPNAAIGLSRDSVTALSLQKEGRTGFSIKQASTVAIPPGACIPSFFDDNLADPAEFANCLQDAVTNAGLLSQRRWSVALPASAARSAIITLESRPSARGETEEILDWKAGQTFGVPAEEMRISLQNIRPDREGRPRYFATAIKLAVIDEYETAFESFGWRVGLILPRAVSEANWLLGRSTGDSILISGQNDGFTALVIRGDEPAVIRTVTCTESGLDDEVYRLLMFYKDRYGSSSNSLDRLLVVGKGLASHKIGAVASDALGFDAPMAGAADIGLFLPSAEFDLSDIAAPAGLALLA
ncbi:MAG: hypothetical protein HS105_08945 [Chloracidobacterium sp.]|nr:hypothetical protein [Chloracidobacterium sp.]MCC6824918.1 hypothetical protein [Acidobacteriota bacterium]MCO5334314.1 hypothetical protein [Pyrinomonadaceae bacterium]